VVVDKQVFFNRNKEICCTFNFSLFPLNPIKMEIGKGEKEFLEDNFQSILGDPAVFKIFGLTTGETNLLRMVWVEEKAFIEIAAILNVPEPSIRKLYSSAAEKLKANIKSWGLELSEIVAANEALQRENNEFKVQLSQLGGKNEEWRKKNLALSKLPIEKLKLSARAYNALRVLKVNTLGDISRCSKTDLMKQRFFGKRTLYLLEEILKEYNIALQD
jgi:hypothetical protein